MDNVQVKITSLRQGYGTDFILAPTENPELKKVFRRNVIVSTLIPAPILRAIDSLRGRRNLTVEFLHNQNDQNEITKRSEEISYDLENKKKLQGLLDSKLITEKELLDIFSPQREADQTAEVRNVNRSENAEENQGITASENNDTSAEAVSMLTTERKQVAIGGAESSFLHADAAIYYESVPASDQIHAALTTLEMPIEESLIQRLSNSHLSKRVAPHVHMVEPRIAAAEKIPSTDFNPVTDCNTEKYAKLLSLYQRQILTKIAESHSDNLVKKSVDKLNAVKDEIHKKILGLEENATEKKQQTDTSINDLKAIIYWIEQYKQRLNDYEKTTSYSQAWEVTVSKAENGKFNSIKSDIRQLAVGLVDDQQGKLAGSWEGKISSATDLNKFMDHLLATEDVKNNLPYWVFHHLEKANSLLKEEIIRCESIQKETRKISPWLQQKN